MIFFSSQLSQWQLWAKLVVLSALGSLITRRQVAPDRSFIVFTLPGSLSSPATGYASVELGGFLRTPQLLFVTRTRPQPPRPCRGVPRLPSQTDRTALLLCVPSGTPPPGFFLRFLIPPFSVAPRWCVGVRSRPFLSTPIRVRALFSSRVFLQLENLCVSPLPVVGWLFLLPSL